MEGLKKTLKEFFFNGCRTRTDLLEPVIKNLTSLMNSLNSLPSYRFYSSSLLLMYDGFEEKEEEASKEEHEKVDSEQVSVVLFSILFPCAFFIYLDGLALSLLKIH